MKAPTALAVAVLGVALATFLGVWVYFGTQSLTAQAQDRTERISVCIEEGGTWLEDYGNCIQ